MVDIEGIINRFKVVLPADRVLTESDLQSRYSHIWRMDQPLAAVAVLLPVSTEEVSEILKLCYAENIKVVVHGGLTNLVGGTETEGDEVVISLERMNKIEELDTQSRSMTVQAGVILENIQQAASSEDMLFPLNFGAKGTAQIGGIISTNAGGLRVLKYGMTRQLVLGLEAVLADGTIISSMKKIIKDNSGYDLKQLFIGGEGTLGIVTKAVLKLTEAPTSRASVMVAMDDYDKVVTFLKYMDKGLAGTLTGYELMWHNFYSMVTSPPSLVKPPLSHDHAYYVLVEAMGSEPQSDKDRLIALTQAAFEEGMLVDAVFADSESDMEWFWKIREDVHVANSQLDHSQHFDISLPVPLIGIELGKINEQLAALEDTTGHVTFGHVADGNIHIIVGKKNDSKELTQRINDIVYTPLKELGGSVSAEHGIGLDKKAYLHHCRSKEELSLMKTLKSALDPKGILNPGRIF